MLVIGYITGNFFSLNNILNIIYRFSMLGLVVIGMSFVILSGGIDFSAGGQMALSGMLMAILIVQCRIPYAASFFITMAAGMFLDGEWYIQDKVPEVLDSMIAKEEIPVMIGLFISPGDKGPGLPRYGGTDNRSMEYDSIDGRYAEFLEKEIISKIKKDYKISDDAWKHGICGISSSGNAAFAAAWNRNDLFTRVLTHVGSFTNIRGGHNFPSMVRKGKRRNLRVFLQTGEHDLNTCFGDWKIANMDMESALKYREYPVHLVIGPGGHSGRYGMSILPESLRWLWKKEDKSGKE
jgi:enterochelin esterase-like enzyme